MTELPTPREAMRAAVDAVQMGDHDGARTWVMIARELRAGSVPRSPLPRLADVGVLAEHSQVALTRSDIAWPDTAAAGDPAETAVMTFGEHGSQGLPRCGYCGHLIEWRNSTPNDMAGTTVVAAWIHMVTMQSVCPVSAPDQAHTFATPAIDERG